MLNVKFTYDYLKEVFWVFLCKKGKNWLLLTLLSYKSIKAMGELFAIESNLTKKKLFWQVKKYEQSDISRINRAKA